MVGLPHWQSARCPLAYKSDSVVLSYRLKWTYKAPSHNSKMVLSIVKIGPPNWTKSRTFTLWTQ